MSKICESRTCKTSFALSLTEKTFCSVKCRVEYLASLKEKPCRACGMVKEISAFQSAKTFDGYSNTCKPCVHERWKKWYEKNQAENRTLNAERNRKHVAAGGESYLFSRRLSRYGLDEERYLKLFTKFDGRCHSCKQAPATDIDHDHKTDEVRGLLCSPCNLGIGNLGDSLARVEAAYRYLLEHYSGAKTELDN